MKGRRERSSSFPPPPSFFFSQPPPSPFSPQSVRDSCIAAGSGWAGSPAQAAGIPEHDYYAALLSSYASSGRLYPYHLAHATARAARVPPAAYYRTALVAALTSDAPYDGALPNFTAADVVAVLGVDRNAYIALAQAVKARAGRRPGAGVAAAAGGLLLDRPVPGSGGGGGGGGAGPSTPGGAGALATAARAAAARDLVPSTQLPLVVVAPEGGGGGGGVAHPPTPAPSSSSTPRTAVLAAPWWRAHAVNVSEAEFRALSPPEVETARAAAAAGGAPLGALDPAAAAALHARGLLYLSVPVGPDDVVAVTSLEGFVSNQDRGGGGGGGGEGRGSPPPLDPLEPLLYALLLAAAGPAGDTVARLAVMLGVDAPRLAAAAGVAARLGFVRVTPASAGGGEQNSPPAPTAPSSVALIIDAAVTSLLMVGHPMSAGLKKHAVTLFEGGRLSGGAAVRDLIAELDASARAAAGEVEGLARAAAALATALRCVVGASGEGGAGVEVVTREALAALGPGPAARLLGGAFRAAVSVWPCPPPPLDGGGLLLAVGAGAGGAAAAPAAPTPAHYGPSAAAQAPWAHLALWSGLAAGPPGALALPAGTLLARLPSARLRRAAVALVWVWPGTGPGPPPRPRGGADGGAGLLGAALLRGGPALLPALNGALTRCGACLVVPVDGGALSPGPAGAPLPPDAPGAALGGAVATADVALPLAPGALSGPTLPAFDGATGGRLSIPTPPGLTVQAAAALGLTTAVGTLRFIRVSGGGGDGGEGGGRPGPGPGLPGLLPPPRWAPLGLALGLPLSAPPSTAAAVCEAAQAAGFLSPGACARQVEGAAAFQAAVGALVARHGVRVGLRGGGGSAAAAAAAATRPPLTDPPVHALAWSEKKGGGGFLKRAGGAVGAAWPAVVAEQ